MVWVCGKVGLVCSVKEGDGVLQRECGRGMDQYRVTGNQVDAINRRKVFKEFKNSGWGKAWFEGKWVEDEHDIILVIQELALRESKAVMFQKSFDDLALSIGALAGEALGGMGICSMVFGIVVEDGKFAGDGKEKGVNLIGVRVGVGEEDVSPLGSRGSLELFRIKVDKGGYTIQQRGMAGEARRRDGGDEVWLPGILEVELEGEERGEDGVVWVGWG
jgi:hypothetical protein